MRGSSEPGPENTVTEPTAPTGALDLLDKVRIVMVATQHPGNIGSAARAMKTMGLTQLVLVAPQNPPDGDSFALASGAADILDAARTVATLEDAISDCSRVIGTSARPRHLGDEPLLPPDAATELTGYASAGADTALVFGCERTGLTNEQLELCHRITMIPANPQYSSLNIAAAIQVFTWELRKAVLTAPPPVSSKHGHPWYVPATAEQMERLYEHLERTLIGTGFLDPNNPRLLMRRLRQLIGRASPDLNEVNILRGILTSVENPKLRTKRRKGEG